MAPSHATTLHTTKIATSMCAPPASYSRRRAALALTTLFGISRSSATVTHVRSNRGVVPTPLRARSHAVHEDARDHARMLMGTAAFDKSRDERKKVEMRFAHLK